MDQQNLDRSGPALLAGLLRLDREDQPCWRDEDLGAVWRHQLAARLDEDLATVAMPDGQPGDARRLAQLTRRGGVRTFAELLQHPRPPVELLEMTKEFAKACRSNAGDDADSGAALPEKAATVLYYASIVAARLRCGRRISKRPDRSILDAARWAQCQSWTDDATRTLFSDYLAVACKRA